MGSQDINQNPSRPGKITTKKGNPFRGDARALFLGPETEEAKERKRLADEWDKANPNGVDEGGGIAPA